MPNPQVEATSYRGEFVRSMGQGSISLENVTLASGQDLVAGTVLGKVTATGKYVILAPGAADGSEVAKAILWDTVDASAADTPVTALVRLAEVKSQLLTWPAGISAPNKATAITQLAGTDLIVRD